MSVVKKFRGIPGMPHLLFFGPPGTGKTSTILAMAKEYYGKALRLMVMEVNASDERGIEVVTGKILSFVQARSFSHLRVKLVILDEADALTVDAQSALRRIMEKFSADVRFCLCCNYVSKISAPLQSRCTKLRFEGIDRGSLTNMVLRIGENEDLSFAQGAVDALLDLSAGDARRVINLLQSASLLGQSNSVVTAECLYNLSGCPVPADIDDFLSVLSEKSFKESFDYVTKRVNEKGYAMVDIVSALAPKVLESFGHDQARLGILLDELSNIEYNLSAGGSEKLAVGHLVSAFHLV